MAIFSKVGASKGRATRREKSKNDELSSISLDIRSFCRDSDFVVSSISYSERNINAERIDHLGRLWLAWPCSNEGSTKGASITIHGRNDVKKLSENSIGMAYMSGWQLESICALAFQECMLECLFVNADFDA